MLLRNLDLDTLRTLVTTHDVGGFSQAADRLGRTPSAISLQMKRLQEELGTPLFRKHGRALKLTEAGQTALGYARRMLALNDDLLQTMQGVTLAGAVRIGAPQDFASVLPDALRQFTALYPRTQIELRIEGNGALIEALDKDQLDLTLTIGFADRKEALLLGELPVLWIASRTFCMRDASLPLAVLGPQCAFRKAAVQQVEAAGIPYRIAATSPSLDGLWAALQGGLGITARTAMQLPASLMAHEICERTGSAAVLEGSITPLGNQYVLGLRAKNCRNGDVLDEEQVQAARKEDVLNALTQIAGRFRTRIGESLATIERHNTPLAEATTPSLEALKAYSTAWRVLITNGSDAAIPLYKRAVEIDPQFAMAYGMLGRVYADMGESGISAEYTTKAWQLRDRVSDRERFFLEASYEMLVTGNLEKSERVSEAWARTYPRDNSSYGFLAGVIYPVQGRYDQAIEAARRAIEADPDFVFGYNILAFEQIAVGDLASSERALHDAEERKLYIPDLSMARYQIAFLKNDQDGMEKVAAQIPREPGAEDWMAHLQSTTLAYFGHLQQATKMSQHSIDLARHGGQLERAALFQSAEAIRSAFFEDNVAAIRQAESALQLSHGRDVQYGAAFALALAGNLPRAQSLADDLKKRFPEDTGVKFTYVPEIRALIALKRHEPTKAIELLRITVPYEQGQPQSSFFGFYGMFYTIYLRGEAYLAENQGIAAAAEFQKILDHRGIVVSDPVGALAHVQLGRALALSGDKGKAKTAYEEFFTAWKAADPEVLVLKQARIESAKLE